MIIHRNLTCPKCDQTDTAKFYREYGVDEWVDDKQAYCKYCGNEMQVGDEVSASELQAERRFDEQKQRRGYLPHRLSKAG